ncbi:MAG: UDP-N-acetylmuramoyl-L-alanine--D-glutamate ligase [Succinivibrionaceae bacterium]|nr:UDP-N-acetylmuramoyl-L-alanine--D-glutamate ligase [Succinivibrionaceae bacterium]
MNPKLNGKSVAVVGLGRSNLATIKYLLRHDLRQLSVFDTRENPPLMEGCPAGLDLHLGSLDSRVLRRFDLIVISPGLSIFLDPIAKARDAGVEVVGDVELFARECRGRVVGITGSNGKSTVTALVGRMLECAGMRVALGANFGNPILSVLDDSIDAYVLELSSFELETTETLHLEAAVNLNVSEDHLDRYGGSIEDYAAFKRRIFTHCDHIVVNRDDPRTYPAPGLTPWASFGLDSSEYGLGKGRNGDTLMVNGKVVFSAANMQIKGRHNELNALAALALCDALGVDRDAEFRALSTFTGLEHRCQLVRELGGISYYNDSKATNVASAQAAIEGLAGNHPKGILLLAGGLGKGQDFSPLERYLGKEVAGVWCFGRDADQILALSRKHCHRALNIQEALLAAHEAARPGQAVLLSPACASFDQFKGFEERGRVFVSLVGQLKEKQ